MNSVERLQQMIEKYNQQAEANEQRINQLEAEAAERNAPKPSPVQEQLELERRVEDLYRRKVNPFAYPADRLVDGGGVFFDGEDRTDIVKGESNE